MIPIDVINPLIPEKDCQVTVEGQTVRVRAQSLYSAAIAYNTERNCRPETHLPALTDDSMIEIRVEGEDTPRSVRWGDVVRWLTRPEAVDPNDSALLRDELKGRTVEHARPPRLEDEGQSGG
jgi:hypothetical protein